MAKKKIRFATLSPPIVVKFLENPFTQKYEKVTQGDSVFSNEYYVAFPQVSQIKKNCQLVLSEGWKGVQTGFRKVGDSGKLFKGNRFHTGKRELLIVILFDRIHNGTNKGHLIILHYSEVEYPEKKQPQRHKALNKFIKREFENYKKGLYD